jgi:hypothetical protein
MKCKMFFVGVVILFSFAFFYACNVSSLDNLSVESSNATYPNEITIYVSRDGENTNDGVSVFSTLRSLQVAIERAREYYEKGYKSINIYVEGGIFYPGEVMNDISSGVGVYLTNVRNVKIVGGWDRSFSFVARNTVLVGNNGSQNFSNIIFVKNANNVSLINFELRGGGSSGAYGGGIRIDDSIGVIVSATKVVSNYGKYGGGIFVYDSRDVLLDVEAYYNSSSLAGGAAYIAGSMGISFLGTIANNSSSYYGGGLFFEDVNYLKVSSKVFSNNSFMGGGIYIDNSAYPSVSTNYILGDLRFNIAELGGGVYIGSTSNIVVGASLISNRANKGGGIYISRADKVTVESTISWNYATNRGGGGYIENSQNITLNGSVSNNGSLEGGGFAIFGSEYVKSFSSVRSNYSLFSGGGFFIDGVSDSYISGVIEINYAVSNGGGILLSRSKNVNLDGSINLNGSLNGGGAFIESSFGVSVSSNLSGNTAYMGGGIYLSYVTNSYIGGYLFNNSATNFGGGMHATGGFLNTIDSKIVSNSSTGPGGGISCLKEFYLTIKGEIVSNFSICGSVYLSKNYETKLSSKIAKNSAIDNTSGVFILASLYYESYDIENSEITENNVPFGLSNYAIFVSNEVQNFSGLKLVSNIIGGVGSKSCGIGEFGYDVNGHVIIGNAFVTNRLGSIYRNYDGQAISISAWSNINIPSSTGASESFSNSVTNL